MSSLQVLQELVPIGMLMWLSSLQPAAFKLLHAVLVGTAEKSNILVRIAFGEADLLL